MAIELLTERLEIRLTKRDKKIAQKLSTKLSVDRRISEAKVMRMGLIDLAHKHNVKTDS